MTMPSISKHFLDRLKKFTDDQETPILTSRQLNHLLTVTVR